MSGGHGHLREYCGILTDEATGFAYAVGTNTCNQGLHIVDVRNNTNGSFVLTLE